MLSSRNMSVLPALRLAAITLILSTLAGRLAHAEDKPAGGWSAELLNQILKAEPAKAELAGTNAQAPAPGEMVLRTYHVANLRVGEAGKAQNLLAILSKLLPAGSSINTDVPANSLHVLTTPAAHKAIWDYLSAVDVQESTVQPAASAVPEEVKAALKKLADAGDQSAKVLAAVGTLKSDVSTEIAQIDARQRQQTLKLLIGGGGLVLALIVTLVWMLRRRSPAPNVAPPQSRELILAPEQLTTALAPVHDKMRTEVLGLLNEVAIKLQAQHNEQQKLVREQQAQLEDARLALAEERKQFISEAGTMVVEAVERVDATTAKLAKQQDKVAELVEELQHTVRELDQTKDNLRTKQVELEQERAKIAALSILLEEGGSAPPLGLNYHPSSEPAMESSEQTSPPPTPSSSCTIPPPMSLAADTIAPSAVPRFKFLPPDHPES